MTENIEVVPYIFGFKDNHALNHICLELKKEIFYNLDKNISVSSFFESFFEKIRKIMIKEKQSLKTKEMLNKYSSKWGNFIEIYDFRGPDQSIV